MQGSKMLLGIVGISGPCMVRVTVERWEACVSAVAQAARLTPGVVREGAPVLIMVISKGKRIWSSTCPCTLTDIQKDWTQLDYLSWQM